MLLNWPDSTDLLKYLTNKVGSMIIMKTESSSPSRDSLFQKDSNHRRGCLQGEASFSPTMTKIYLDQQEGGSCMKSFSKPQMVIRQFEMSRSSADRLIWSIYFRQVG